MIGCLGTRVPKQPIIALDFESENELKFYNLKAPVSSKELRALRFKFFFVLFRPSNIFSKARIRHQPMDESFTSRV